MSSKSLKSVAILSSQEVAEILSERDAEMVVDLGPALVLVVRDESGVHVVVNTTEEKGNAILSIA